MVISPRAIASTGAGHPGLPDPATQGCIRPGRFADRAIEVLPLAAAGRARDIAAAAFISAATAGVCVPDVRQRSTPRAAPRPSPSLAGLASAPKTSERFDLRIPKCHGRPWCLHQRIQVRASIRTSLSEARTTIVASTAGTRRTWSPFTTQAPEGSISPPKPRRRPRALSPAMLCRAPRGPPPAGHRDGR